MQNIERRFIRNLELRSRSGVSYNSAGILSGYAVRWGTNSGNLNGFIERIAPMCFSRSLAKGADVRALINHDPNLLIGRRSTGTLRLNEDVHGLSFDCDVADTSYGRDLMKLVARKDLTSMSFAFVAGDTDWDSTTDPDTGEEIPLRTIRSADISDISCVTYPAYETSSVGVRDLEDDCDESDDPDCTEYDSRIPTFNADPMTMDALSAMSPRALFPQGIPLEIRSHVPNFKAVVRTQRTVQERRRRLTSLFL
jgi:HK97 family phage prohead protease